MRARDVTRGMDEGSELHTSVARNQQSWDDEKAGDQLDTGARDERCVHGISPPGYTRRSKSHGLTISPIARGLWGELAVTSPPCGSCPSN